MNTAEVVRVLEEVRGADLRRLRADIQAVFQDPLGSLNPRMTVGDAVEEPIREFIGGDRRQRRERVSELFEMVEYAGGESHGEAFPR